MKKLKQIIAQILPLAAGEPTDELNDLVWQFICYPPKMPLRLQQSELLQAAEHTTLTVNDDHFAHKPLNFNCFKWGNGHRRIIITHGWGSKAADLMDIISALRGSADVQIIAYDVPGNGSSEGELSNLLLFVQAAKAVIQHYGEPDVLIGHSIGALANVITLRDTGIIPKLLVSLTPLLRLEENFKASMAGIGLSAAAQSNFLKSFEAEYHRQASSFDMEGQYDLDKALNHFLVYDEQDLVSPYTYLSAFLAGHPQIKTLACNGAGHDRILRSPEMLTGLTDEIKRIG